MRDVSYHLNHSFFIAFANIIAAVIEFSVFFQFIIAR